MMGMVSISSSIRNCLEMTANLPLPGQPLDQLVALVDSKRLVICERRWYRLKSLVSCAM